ncbi:hypothetical protein MNV49_003119 [Pseudohyphozyma bogoriensis]|nr:hypothetical protein MNV49_003119 [Pseudohyphozyma bogoriensis]
MTDYGTPASPPPRDVDVDHRRPTIDDSYFLDFHPPGANFPPFSFEERFQIVERAWHAHYPDPPSVVITNFGAWDLRAMFVNEVFLNISTPVIPPELLDSYTKLAEKAFALLKLLFPVSHHAHFALHNLNTDEDGRREAWYAGMKTSDGSLPSRVNPVLFTAGRITGLQEAYSRATTESGMEVLDAKALYLNLPFKAYLKDDLHLSEDLGIP